MGGDENSKRGDGETGVRPPAIGVFSEEPRKTAVADDAPAPRKTLSQTPATPKGAPAPNARSAALEAVLARLDALTAAQKAMKATLDRLSLGGEAGDVSASAQSSAQATVAFGRLEARLQRLEARLEARLDAVGGGVGSAQAREAITDAVRGALTAWRAENPDRPAQAAATLDALRDLRTAVDALQNRPAPKPDAALLAEIRESLAARAETAPLALDHAAVTRIAEATAKAVAAERGATERGTPEAIALDVDAQANALHRLEAAIAREETAVDALSDLGEALAAANEKILEDAERRLAAFAAPARPHNAVPDRAVAPRRGRSIAELLRGDDEPSAND